jgi:outer membrane protein TolC
MQMRILKRYAAFIAAGACVCATPKCIWGQLGAPGSSQAPGPARANQLPLSGRTAQTGSVAAVESPVPGATTSVNTVNPSVEVEGPYGGSSGANAPFSGKLSLHDAIERALHYNLGAIGVADAAQQAHGEARVARSALLPNLNGSLSETLQQLDLQAVGFRFKLPVPGFSIPAIVGPFNYFDLRASLSQSLMDMTAWNNYRSAQDGLHASQLSAKDARDLVTLAVGGAYLQAISAAARVQSARAQLETANALLEQTSQQRAVGLVAQIDVNRSRVQMLTQRQRLTSLENDLAKQKINLARIVGLPPNDQYEIADDVPFAPAPDISLQDALRQAFTERWDLKAAEAQVQAAQRARSAARAEHLPSVTVSADYGAIGPTPGQARATFSVVGSLKVPIWQGGRIEGDVEQANAALAQRQAELEDLRAKVESDVRNAYLDLGAARSQVDVARENLGVTQDNLKLTRQRFDAGVSDNVDVVQSQEAVASAELDYVNSVFAHNVAKLSLARAIGRAGDKLTQFLDIRAR